MVDPVGGRFVLVDPIGRGASGQVWRAYDIRNRVYCAAKLFRRRDASDLIRVVREQGVRLRHPHLVCPYAWTADDDDVLIAMELMPGGSLSTLIRDHGALPVPYAARVLGQLLSALAHVHEAGLVHRDVKPDNVLLRATGTGVPHAALADFGIVSKTDESPVTETGMILGTPGYLAPEVYAGAGTDPARDLFALGVVARQLLTGHEDARTYKAPPGARPPDSVPAALWEIVRSLCDPSPERRPRDARAAGAMLAEVSRHLPLTIPAYTAHGEPVEVFDQLGPLPSGFSPEGPVVGGAAARTSRDAASADGASTVPRRGPSTAWLRRAGGWRTRFAAGGIAVVLLAGAAYASGRSDHGGRRQGAAPVRPASSLTVMTWATCANGRPSAAPSAPGAICVNGGQTDKVADGIRARVRDRPELNVLFLQELCSADVDRLRSMDGMSGWRFRFAPILDRGNGVTRAARVAPRPCPPQNGVSRGFYGIAVGVREPTSFDVHYYPEAGVPDVRDRWGHWSVHQVAVCATVAAYRAKVCGTQLTPLRGLDPRHPDAFWRAQVRQVKDLIAHAGVHGRVVVGGDLNSLPPEAGGGAGRRSPLTPLYDAYRECDQAIQGGARAGRGTYQHPDGTRGAKLDYLFASRDAKISCDVTSAHVSASDQVPVVATITFPGS